MTEEQHNKLCALVQTHVAATSDRAWAGAKSGVNSQDYRDAQKVSAQTHKNLFEYAAKLVEITEKVAPGRPEGHVPDGT